MPRYIGQFRIPQILDLCLRTDFSIREMPILTLDVLLRFWLSQSLVLG